MSYITHIPAVGRHGLMLSERSVTPNCVMWREVYDEGNLEDRFDSPGIIADIMERMVDDDGTCRCILGATGGTGFVWSVMMSLPLPKDWREKEWEEFGDEHYSNTFVDRLSAQAVAYEERVRARYAESDLSLASGQTYGEII